MGRVSDGMLYELIWNRADRLGWKAIPFALEDFDSNLQHQYRLVAPPTPVGDPEAYLGEHIGRRHIAVWESEVRMRRTNEATMQSTLKIRLVSLQMNAGQSPRALRLSCRSTAGGPGNLSSELIRVVYSFKTDVCAEGHRPPASALQELLNSRCLDMGLPYNDCSACGEQ